MVPGTPTFLAAPEQSLFDENVLPVRPVARPRPAIDKSKFQSMSGQKRSSSALGDDDEDGEDDDEGDDGEDEEGEAPKGGKVKNHRKRNATSTGRRKINISYIDDKSKRHVSFTKRKAGLMKKAFELSTLTGTECLILVVSETSMVYTYATPTLQPLVATEQGVDIIQASMRGDLESYKLVKSDSNAAPTAPAPPPLPSPIPTSVSHDLQVDPEFTPERAFFDRVFPDASSSSTSAAPPQSAATAAQDFPPGFEFPSLPQPFASTSSVPYSTTAEAFESFPTEHFPSFQPPLASYTTIGATPPSSYTDPSSSAYERAAADHQRSFAAYSRLSAKSRTPRPGETPKSWRFPAGLPPHLRPDLVGTASGSAEAGMRDATERSLSDGQAARKVLKLEAQAAIDEASENRDIPSFIRAHSLHTRSQGSLTLAFNPAAPDGICSTMRNFGQACAELGFTAPHQLELASQVFLERILPHRKFTSKRLQEARTHLALFFDFLESHSFISPSTYNVLTAFHTKPVADLYDLVDGGAALTRWSDKARETFQDRTVGCPVEGWFEIYRVRDSYCLFKEKELKGDATLNACLSPFKVRMPRALTPFLRIDDAAYLTIQQVADKPYCIPTLTLGFERSTSVDDAESDIDPSSYAAELERLETLPDRDEEAIKFGREVFEMLTRAQTALQDGELSDC